MRRRLRIWLWRHNRRQQRVYRDALVKRTSAALSMSLSVDTQVFAKSMARANAQIVETFARITYTQRIAQERRLGRQHVKALFDELRHEIGA